MYRYLYYDASRIVNDWAARDVSGVAAVERALSLLDAFMPGDEALSLAELAARTGLYKSTILRLVESLIKSGYLNRLGDGRYQLGPSNLRLGELYQASFKLEDHVTPALKRLADSTGESASFHIRDGNRRICLFRVNSLAHRVLLHVTPGHAFPLHTGAAGKVLMAFLGDPDPADSELEAVRASGLAISDRDRIAETAAVASPVFGREGLLGALSLAGPRVRFDSEARERNGEQVLAEAKALTRSLGGRWLSQPGRAA